MRPDLLIGISTYQPIEGHMPPTTAMQSETFASISGDVLQHLQAMMKVVLFRLSVMGRNRILQRRHCRCTCAQSGSVIAAVFERVKMLLFPQQNCHGDGVVTGE